MIIERIRIERKMKYCPHCGHEHPDNDQYCSKCGSPLVYKQVENKPVQQTRQKNAFAIAGFILSFFSIVLGAAFSFIGYGKSVVINGEGRKLAKAGIIISFVHFGIYTIMVILRISGVLPVPFID